MKAKKCSAREALRQAIKPGDRVFFSIASGQPQSLLQALAEDFEHYHNVEVVSGYLLTEHPLARPGFESSFHCVSLQISPSIRKAWEEGRIDFIPMPISDVPFIYSAKGPTPVDVALVQVSLPDSDGRVSLGVSTSMAYPLAAGARTIVAEVNDKAPQTMGPCSFPVSEIDYLVESSAPLIPYPEIKIGDTEHRIAEFVAELIPDGATLQIGIGNLPAAILQLLQGKKDLGVHSGMLSDGIVDLVEKGTINNRRKNIFPGKIVAGELIGTEKLFRFSHNNALLEMHSAEVSHNARLIAEIDDFISINSVIEIDLTGQINAESLNGLQISGVGGQFDFVAGAYFSRGGKSITALTATATKGTISRIVPRLAGGAAVTIPRYLTDIVVTEFGIAKLRGKSFPRRAEALISIAHPAFRDELWEAFPKKEKR
ncbi:MAG: acetyl-CoA hydrolase/transferase family protein [Deltaproteobacteria bacterium]|nr:acetyl-CoA hydrolase/transferase family protein [Deltaproteobacteria bacterium]